MLKIIYPSLSKKVSIEAITLTTKKDGIHLRFRNLKTVNSNLKIPDLDLTIDYNLEKKINIYDYHYLIDFDHNNSINQDEEISLNNSLPSRSSMSYSEIYKFLAKLAKNIKSISLRNCQLSLKYQDNLYDIVNNDFLLVKNKELVKITGSFFLRNGKNLRELSDFDKTYFDFLINQSGDVNLMVSKVPIVFSNSTLRLSLDFTILVNLSVTEMFLLKNCSIQLYLHQGNVNADPIKSNQLYFKNSFWYLHYDLKEKMIKVTNKIAISSNNQNYKKIKIKGVSNSEGQITFASKSKLRKEEIFDYWPSNFTSNLRNWLKERIKDGIVQKTLVNFSFITKQQEAIDLKKDLNIFSGESIFIPSLLRIFQQIELNDFNIFLRIDNGSFDYLFNNIPARMKRLNIAISPRLVDLSSKTVDLLDLAVRDLSCQIPLQESLQINLQFAIAKQSLTNLIVLLKKHDVEAKDNQNNLSQKLKETIDSKISSKVFMTIPLQDKITMADIKIKSSGNVVGDLKFSHYSIASNIDFIIDNWQLNFDASFNHKNYEKVQIKGQSNILLNKIYFQGNLHLPIFLKNNSITIGGFFDRRENILSFKSSFNDKNIRNPLFNYISDIFVSTKNTKNSKGKFDCLLQIKNEKDFIIDRYLLTTSNFKAQGRALLQPSQDKFYIKSHLKGSNGDFIVVYDSNNKKNIEITSDYFDLSPIDFNKFFHNLHNDKKDTTPSFANESIVTKVKLARVKLKNEQELQDLTGNIQFKNDNIDYLNVESLINNNGYIRAFYSFPTFAFVTNNSGDFFKGLDFYTNIHEGKLELKGNIIKEETNNFFKSFDGDITIYKFYLVNAPILSTILRLSVFSPSFTNLAAILQNKGITIYNANCLFSFDNISKDLNLYKCFAVGDTLLAQGSGLLKNGQFKFSGMITPLHFFNTAILFIKKFFPKLGNLFLNSKEDRSNFTITKEGEDDIVVNVNPLSLALPGILGEMLAKKQEQQ